MDAAHTALHHMPSAPNRWQSPPSRQEQRECRSGEDHEHNIQDGLWQRHRCQWASRHGIDAAETLAGILHRLAQATGGSQAREQAGRLGLAGNWLLALATMW